MKRPPLLDLDAAERDEPLYELLYSITKPIAFKEIKAAFDRTTTEAATDLIAQEISELKALLVDQNPNLSDETQLVVSQEIKQSLQSDFNKDEAQLEFIDETATEFTTALWAAWLGQMLNNSVERYVQKDDYLPTNGAFGDRWRNFSETIHQFQVPEREIFQIMKGTLQRLRAEEPNAQAIQLPLNLLLQTKLLPEPAKSSPFNHLI